MLQLRVTKLEQPNIGCWAGDEAQEHVDNHPLSCIPLKGILDLVLVPNGEVSFIVG